MKAKDAPKKAVLISGPPGIGKTSAAKIICAALGFDVMEINASDARGKVWTPSRPALHATSLSPAQAESDVKSGLNGKSANMVKEMVTNSSVNFGSGPSKRQVLIMDEVDGMSGGDRGGVQDLMNSIKARPVVPRLASPLTPLADFQGSNHLHLQRRVVYQAPLAEELLPGAAVSPAH